VRTKRQTKSAVFLEVNDGSCMANIQCVFSPEQFSAPALAAELERCGTCASVQIDGRLIPSPGAGQKLEVAANSLKLIGEAPAES
jgi:asparaginyl-tRNA synthetase